MTKTRAQKQQEEEAILFGAIRTNSKSDEHALMDFELIQNLLSYQKVHILQPMKGKNGYKTRSYRTMQEQFSFIIGQSIEERKQLGLL